MGANAKIIVPQETNSEFVSSQNEDTEFSVPDQPASNQSSSIKCAKKTTYTVKYNANGGSNAPASQTKTKGKSLTLSRSTPTRTGYNFQGWTTQSYSTTVIYNPGASYTYDRNITLYAVWKIKTYKITYNANGGSSQPSPQSKTHGKKLVLSSSTPKRTGYTFKGWAIRSNSNVVKYEPGDYYTDDNDINLYAVWKIKTYTVSYNANKGTGAPTKQKKTYGVTLTLQTEKPTRDGYTFKGWAKKSKSDTVSYKAGAKYTKNASITLYAVWEPATYKITYHLNGGTNGPANQTKQYGTPLKLSTKRPSKAGYTFMGWGTSKNATKITYNPGGYYLQDESESMYALWAKTKTASFNEPRFLLSGQFYPACADIICNYNEYYMTTDEQIVYLKHSSFLGINLEQLNDEDSCTITYPQYVTHTNNQKEINKFFVNIKEPELAIYDYSFSYSDNTRVVYNKANCYEGSIGFMIRVDGFPLSKKLTLQLGTDTPTKSQMYYANTTMSQHSLTYYEDLGKAARQKLNTSSEIKHKSVTTSEQETLIREKAAKIQSSLPSTSNYNEYLAFITGTGLTEDEYWELIINQAAYESSHNLEEQE